MSFKVLNGKWIVITRPKKQAQSFGKNIEKVGGCPFYFPLIEITPNTDEETTKRLLTLVNYDVVIFVSVNSVEECIKHVGSDILKHKTLVTVGKKTAASLLKYNLTVDFCPDQFFNSEALLSIDDFKKHSKDKKIAIVRGTSGRDYLKNKLIDLGASVDYMDVYSRHCPQTNLHQLEKQWKKGKVDAITLTSASSTANFFALAKNDTWLDEVTLLIGSSRMQHEIPIEFRGKILVAEDPSDETLLQKLTDEL